MRSLKVLLINAANPLEEPETRQPHLGLAYLAAMARRQLPGAKLEFKIAEREVKAAIADFQPDLAGISSVSQNFNIALNYAAALAEAKVPVVMGGIHLSALPNTLPPTALAAALGEGEQTFVEIIEAALGGGLPQALPHIRGIAYRQDGEMVHSAPRPLLEDLNEIPFPARDLLPIRPHTSMFTSRGCPYRCTFCASSRFWNKIRFFSAEYVVEEIQYLHRDYQVDMVSFYDDLFPAKIGRLEEMIELLDRKGLLGKIKFTTNCRANLVSARLTAVLKRLGIVSVGLGLESGDDETLAYLKGGSVSVADNYNAVKQLKAAGIAANASFVIGSPQESREKILKTYHFIRGSDIDLFDVYLLTPFPGTPVWDQARQKGLVSDDMPDWSVLDVNLHQDTAKAVILSETMSREQLLSLYRKFRRLRLWHNLSRVWSHPLRRSLPRVALKYLESFLGRMLRRVTGR